MAPSTTTGSTQWTAHPVLGRALQLAVFVGPFVVALFVSYGLSTGMPPAETTAAEIAQMLLLLVVSLIVMFSADRVARLAAPMAVLLRLTMVFPDKAPSRIKLAMRTSSEEELRRTVEEVQNDGLGKTASEAAETLLVLVASLSKHDRLTRGHSERVRGYADVIAGELGLSTDDRSKLRWAALLHDVGKVNIPSEILNKPGKLTDTEYRIIQDHPRIGADLVEPLREFLGPWADAVEQHHERWDGLGYPHGLQGQEISLGARIVSVADTFDVITSVRSYKKSMSAADARQEIADCAGKQFDPDIVRAFLGISIGRFRWGLGPLSVLTQIPQIAAVLTPASTVAAAAPATAPILPTMASGLAALGAVVAVAPMPINFPMFGDQTTVEVLASVDDEASAPIDGEGPVVVELVSSSSESTPPTSVAVAYTFEASTTSELVSSVPISVVVVPPTTTPATTSAPAPTTAPPVVVTKPTAPPLSTTPPTPVTTLVATTAPPSTTTTAALPTTTTTSAPTTTSEPAPTWSPSAPDGELPPTFASCLGIDSITAVELRQDGRVDFYGCDLGDYSLANYDLTDLHVHGGDWSGLDFTGAELAKAEFTEIDLAGVSFAGANLRDADFKTVDLSHADFTGALFDHTHVEHADLSHATLKGADLKEFQIQSSTLVGADLSNSSGTDFSLKNTDLTGANLSNATYEKANFEGANLTGVNASGGSFTEVKLQRAKIEGLNLSGTDVHKLNLDDATGRATLGSGLWTESKCPDSSLPLDRVCPWL